MAITPFALPRDASIYVDTIFDRCRELIAYNVWAGIEMHQLDAWIANFKTSEERYLAARMLDALIYRSKSQCIAMMKQLFQRVIPDMARRSGLTTSLLNTAFSLRDRVNDPRIRIVPVFAAGDPPTKSGLEIARQLKRKLQFCEKWVLMPGDVPQVLTDIDAIIFVDDFLGTGEQFLEFIAVSGLSRAFGTCCCVYAPLAAHVDGINSITQQFGNIFVRPVEELDDTHAFFSDVSGSFPDGTNSAESAREFYYDLLKNRQIAISGPSRCGFGHYELLYAFEHAVPDNSLPVLWWRDTPGWAPLLTR